MKRNNKKGFTIVELVIVIAVIAILSAVLIPTFGTVIADANNVARDQEAKNLYTTYIAEQAKAGNDVTDGKIVVDNYVYTVSAGQIDLENEVETETANIPATHLTCNKSGCTHAPAADDGE